jgi:hypothetical protein
VKKFVVGQGVYCRNMDGMGYCCTTPMLPGRVLCDTHMLTMAAESPYLRIPGVGTNPMTAKASEEALKLVGNTTVPSIFGITSPPSVSGIMAPPDTPPALKNLGDQMNEFAFFKNIADTFETPDWVKMLESAPEVEGNKYSKKLALFVAPKMGIDFKDAIQPISDGSNIRVLASAGVKMLFLVCELLTRNALWNGMPYLQYLLEQKYKPDTAEFKKAKVALVDALSLFDKDVPKLFGDTFSGLFYKAQTALQYKNPDELSGYPLPQGILPPLGPTEIVADLIRGLIARSVGLLDPNVLDPPNVVATMLSNLSQVDLKFKCVERGVGTITDACWAWAYKQAGAVPKRATIAEYVEDARKLLPAFVAVFK